MGTEGTHTNEKLKGSWKDSAAAKQREATDLMMSSAGKYSPNLW
jgi:hypothetical protein